MMNVPMIGASSQPKLTAGQNAVIEVQRELSGSAKLILRDQKHPNGYAVSLDPKLAIAVGLALMEAVGVPINEEIGRRLVANGERIFGG